MMSEILGNRRMQGFKEFFFAVGYQVSQEVVKARVGKNEGTKCLECNRNLISSV